jgi:carbohydrate kinase (thermoresistant glucokinase family)
MGVSGSGKTTIGEALAARLGWPFEEGDKRHPEANVAKMHAGVPLTDADRAPWLAAVAAWIDDRRDHGGGGVISCSALKRAYRRVVIGDRTGVRLVYLRGDRDLIAQRIAARRHHFMPPGLLRSQFDTLEEPGPDEDPIVVDVAPPPAEIVAAILRRLGLPA